MPKLSIIQRMFGGMTAERRYPEQAEKQRRAKYEQVFNSPEGRWVLADMARMHGVFSGRMRKDGAGGADALQMAFDTGARSVVLDLLRMVDEPLIDHDMEVLTNDGIDT